jgi:hypothetical protein
MKTALIIPTIPNPLGDADRSDIFCGSYLNQLSGQTSSGVVTGVAKHIFQHFHGLMEKLRPVLKIDFKLGT